MAPPRLVQVGLLVAAAGAIIADHGPTPFDAYFAKHGPPRKVPVNLLRAIARVESGLNPAAVSPPNRNGTRDRGLMQINDGTAAALKLEPKRLLEAEYSIAAAVELLVRVRGELRERFGTIEWIAAYNAGSPAIKARGVFNVGYVSSVLFHLIGYDLADGLGSRR